jgi:hypothetical protein
MCLTLLTAFASGSTVGRRLFGIQMRKLDAHPLTVWESFERFAGSLTIEPLTRWSCDDPLRAAASADESATKDKALITK